MSTVHPIVQSVLDRICPPADAGPLCKVTVATPYEQTVTLKRGQPGDLHAQAMADLPTPYAVVSVVVIKGQHPRPAGLAH